MICFSLALGGLLPAGLGPGGLLRKCLLQLFSPLLGLFPYVFDDFEQVIGYFELIYFVVTTTIVSFQLVLV